MDYQKEKLRKKIHLQLQKNNKILRTVAQTVKRLPTMWDTRVQSLGWENVLEKEMAIHSSILAWKIPRTEEPVASSPWVTKSQRQLSDFTFTFTKE